MAMNTTEVVIVGAGHAGVECAVALRSAGFEGDIALLGEETDLPYDRPPLSKALLSGERSADKIALRSEQSYSQSRIQYLPGTRVQSLDAAQRELRTTDGTSWHFKWAVLATGARARTVPGLQGAGVFSIRQLADVAALRPLLQPGSKLLVLGAGYLGLEAACTAAKLGAQVTVLEQANGILPGRVSAVTAERLLALHQAQGVQVRTDCRVTEWRSDTQGRWEALLADGSTLLADFVLVAVGAEPNTALAEAAGIVCDGGIWVDETARTSVPHVFAIGDCAAAVRSECGRRMRVESVNNALTQARAAAAAITGQPQPAHRPPTFWSEQCGRRLQMAGLLDPALPIEDHVLDTSRGWLVERRQGGLLRAIEAVDSPVDFMRGMQRIELPGAVSG